MDELQICTDLGGQKIKVRIGETLLEHQIGYDHSERNAELWSMERKDHTSESKNAPLQTLNMSYSS